jgi:periplasmic protein TonB
MDANHANATLDDIVFEGRNKEYGAYQLRKSYAKYLTRSSLIGITIFSGAIFAAWSMNQFKSNNDDLQAVEIDLSKLKEEKPEEEKKPDIPPPPPPPEKPPEVAQIKFLPPEPKADEEVKEEDPPPKVEEVEKAVISNVTKEGVETEEIAAPPPPADDGAGKPAEVEQPKEEEIFTTVEQNPEFPGGIRELYKYIGANLKYPSAAQRANVSGKVFVKFVVEKDGSVGEVNILKGIGFGCDEEAGRVIKSLPKFAPGKQNGRNVRVWYTLPVSYVLE